VVSLEHEEAAERDRRHYQRGLFDQVARLYEATRPGYPAGLAEFVAATAGAGAGAAVLDLIISGPRFTGSTPVSGSARPPDAAAIAGSGLFEAPVHRTFTQRLIRPAEDVIGVENTRATALSWPDDVRRGFTEELRQHLRSRDGVRLTLEASVAMARARRANHGERRTGATL
jgi:hypothetical protein